MGADEVVDLFDEVGGGMKRAATDGALSDEGKEAFDLVEPGGIGGREVNVPTRTACEPSSDLRMLVGGVVVDDEMDVELGWHVGLDVTQEGEEFLMAMARTLQWVAALGLRASVLVISSATASSSTVRGLPLRISS